MTATTFTNRRELAYRTSDGIEISLFWSKATDLVTVAVLDTGPTTASSSTSTGAPPSTPSTTPTRMPPHGAFAASPGWVSRSLTDHANETSRSSPPP